MLHLLHLYYLYFLLASPNIFAYSTNVNTTATLNITTNAPLVNVSDSHTTTAAAAATTTTSSSSSSTTTTTTTTVSSSELSSGVLTSIGVCVGLLCLALTVIACIICYRGFCTKCCDCLQLNTSHCLSHNFWQPTHSHCHHEQFLWPSPTDGPFIPHTPVLWTPPLYEDLVSRDAALCPPIHSSPPPSYVSDDVSRTTTTTTTTRPTTSTTTTAAAANNDNNVQRQLATTTTTTTHNTLHRPVHVTDTGHSEASITTSTTASTVTSTSTDISSTTCNSDTVNTCAVMSQVHCLSPPGTNLTLALSATHSTPLHSTPHHVVLFNTSRPTQVNIPASFQSLENIDYTIFGSTCQGVNNITNAVRARPRAGNSSNTSNNTTTVSTGVTGLLLDPAMFVVHSTSTLNTQL